MFSGTLRLLLSIALVAIVAPAGAKSAVETGAPIRPVEAAPADDGPLGASDLLALLGRAEHGDSAAQAELAWRYLYGKSVDRDPEAGLAWARKSAAQEDPGGELTLGLAYYFGE